MISRSARICGMGFAFAFLTPANAQPVDMGRFLSAAEQEVAKQMSSYKSQVGTHYSGDKPVEGLKKTDCFIFTGSVIANSLASMGHQSHAAAVRKMTEDGGDLAKYLVEKMGWTSWYWNPDVRHPQDLKEDHTYYAAQAARSRKHAYLGPQHPDRFVPIQRYLVNYDPVPEEDYGAEVADFRITRKNTAGIDAIRRNRFCFGITDGSMHTFLVMKGKVQEVHWDVYGPDSPAPTSSEPNKLYEVSDFFESFSSYRQGGWLSGVLVCSPDPEPLPESTATFDKG